jgi:tetratricopeptide (TPR) repeat protein
LELNPNISSKGQYLNDLATLFERKYAVTHEIDDLHSAIRSLREQIDFLKPRREYGELVFAYKKLDELLKQELKTTHSLEAANAIVDLAKDGLQLFPDNLQSHCQIMLGYALHTRYGRTGSVDDLDKSIRSLRTPFNGLPERNMGTAGVEWGEVLGHALHQRYTLTGTAEDLQALAEIRGKVLAATPSGHAQRGFALNHMSLVYIGQYRLSKDSSKLDDAEAALREALDLTKGTDAHRAAVLNNLGCCYEERYHDTGADFDAAIKAFADSADTAPFGDTMRLASRQNMEALLVERYERTGSMDDLVTAVMLLQDTAESLPKDHPWRFRVLYSLGQCFLAVADNKKGEERLDYCNQAIQTLMSASEVPSIAANQDNLLLNVLAGALMTRYSINDKSDLAASIEVSMRSLKQSERDTSERSSKLHTLATILHMKFRKNKDTAVLDKAIEIAQEAVRISTMMVRGDVLFLLGKCLESRYDLNQSPEDQKEAIHKYTGCLNCATCPAKVRIRAARAGAKLAAPKQQDHAFEMLSAATELLPTVSPRAFYRQDQQYALAACAGVASDAAALAMRCGKTPEQALRLLEVGRGVIINSQLETRSDITDLEAVHPDLALKFQHLREACQEQHLVPSTSFKPVDGGKRNSVLQIVRRNQPFGELEALIKEIRTRSGFEGFLLPPTPEEMMKLARTAPLVYLNPSRFGCDAFIIQEHGIKHIPLDKLSFLQIEENATALMAAQKNDSLRTRKQSNMTLRKMLEWLWDGAVEMILNELGFTSTPETEATWPRLFWIPVGLLSLFPIHAAGYAEGAEGENSKAAPDRVVSSYIPTAKALKYAMESDAAACASKEDDSLSFLMVAMPTTPDYPPLDFTTAEVSAIDALLPSHVARTTLQTPSRAAVIAAISTATVAHFSCHGVVSPDPSRSAILLSDWRAAPLCTEDITRLPLQRARLAFLSACHSASNVSLPLLDEAIHLASAWALAGFHTVIGTLWHVDDTVSAEIAESFYATLVAVGSGGEDGAEAKEVFDFENAARALHFAVRKVLKKKRKSRRDDPMTWAAYIHTGV